MTKEDEIGVVIKTLRLVSKYCGHKASEAMAKHLNNYTLGQACAFDKTNWEMKSFRHTFGENGKPSLDLYGLENKINAEIHQSAQNNNKNI